MRKRIISALIALPIVLFLLWMGGYFTLLLIAVVVVMANLEYYKLTMGKGIAHCPAIAIGMSLVYLLDAFYYSGRYALPLTAMLLALSLIRPVLRGEPAGSVAGTASTTFAALYFGWSLSHAILLRSSSPGLEGFVLVLSLLGLVWLHDTAALMFGIALKGRTKIAPKISPKKSLEGSIGGFLTLIALMFLIYPQLSSRGLLPEIDLIAKIILIVVAVICCNYGDLGESALKRDTGVKDSGVFLPGHGGFMDRIDSLLLFVPASYWLFKLFLGW